MLQKASERLASQPAAISHGIKITPRIAAAPGQNLQEEGLHVERRSQHLLRPTAKKISYLEMIPDSDSDTDSGYKYMSYITLYNLTYI